MMRCFTEIFCKSMHDVIVYFFEGAVFTDRALNIIFF